MHLGLHPLAQRHLQAHAGPVTRDVEIGVQAEAERQASPSIPVLDPVAEAQAGAVQGEADRQPVGDREQAELGLLPIPVQVGLGPGDAAAAAQLADPPGMPARQAVDEVGPAVGRKLERPALEGHPAVAHPVGRGEQDRRARLLLVQLAQDVGLVQQLVPVDREREQVAARRRGDQRLQPGASVRADVVDAQLDQLPAGLVVAHQPGLGDRPAWRALAGHAPLT